MHVVMKLISPRAKMYISLMCQSLLHRCLGFSFSSMQDYGRQNLAFLAKLFLLGHLWHNTLNQSALSMVSNVCTVFHHLLWMSVLACISFSELTVINVCIRMGPHRNVQLIQMFTVLDFTGGSITQTLSLNFI